ncbi:MAG: dihydrofolate reductase family protein [Caulobacterales bacterium]
MPSLSVFNNISLDGYFTDASNDMSWAHEGSDDAEFQAFTNGNAQSDGVLVFGRITYDMMASWWPTPQAAEAMPLVAQRMNDAGKIVFSRSMEKPAWQKTTLISADPAAAMAKLKSGDGKDMVMMGSGEVVALMTEAGLIDEFQFVVCPCVLGAGRSMFDGVSARPRLTLQETRTFKNGKVFLSYRKSA